MEEKKKSSDIPFVAVVVVLVINILIYKWDELAGGLFFTFFGFWFLVYGLYKIAKTFWPDL
jgi:hypothetical protein